MAYQRQRRYDDPYTSKELQIFVTTWQTSSSVAEVVERLLAAPGFRDEYARNSHGRGGWTDPARLNLDWARQRAYSLKRKGVNLQSLPFRIYPPSAPCTFYSDLNTLAESLSEES
jgi:hypothetical protein